MSGSRSPRERARAAFAATYGQEPDRLFRAPGRVNLIGEHTDYNDGFVLPAAIDLHTVAAMRRSSTQVRVHAVDEDAHDAFDCAEGLNRHPSDWANYVRGVADELRRAGLAPQPADIAVAGNVPPGSGLSSSAAIEVAIALALTGGAGDVDTLARVAQAAENNFVGASCGIMDQLISLGGVDGHALLIDCRDLSRRPVPLPANLAVVVIDSGVRHSNVGGGYGERRAQCEAAARHYGVPALRDLDEAALEAGKADLDEQAYRRARHVVTENARVLAAAEALAAGDMATVGKLMAESHRSMRDDFEITTPEIDHLASLAGDVVGRDGGARMTGGGFGGCVVALLPEDRVPALRERIEADYRTSNGEPPSIHVCRASAGAGEI